IPMTSIADPTASGDLVSRQHFAEFALPYLQALNADTRSKGAYTLLHICGDTTDKLDLLIETGADCVSIDHKVHIERAKDIFNGKMCCVWPATWIQSMPFWRVRQRRLRPPLGVRWTRQHGMEALC
ncbi:MAG: hypothetical protein GTO63_13240, partial [Anaerolineae bacterium]|nr:hypothetical protein [Anaerolineae bacterium]NIN95808.1 hypothetical protein [Anaerolineae bacterium]NIQ78774.1 hypothetical protein [Anaerolineae bacterium]